MQHTFLIKPKQKKKKLNKLGINKRELPQTGKVQL